MTKEVEEKMKSTIHDFVMPILITAIGALVSVILWFLIKVHDRVDNMYTAVIDQTIRVERMDTEKNELKKNYTEFKVKTQQDIDRIDGDIDQIKLDVGIINSKASKVKK